MSKIRELAQKATDYCANKDWKEDESTAWVWEEKFAELIIEDCLSVLHDRSKQDNTKYAKDMFGQSLSVGDYVVSFNYVYKLVKVSEFYVTGKLYPSKNTTRNKSLYAKEIVKVSKDLVENV